MQISGLPATTTFNDNTVFAVENNGITAKLTGAAMKQSNYLGMKAIGGVYSGTTGSQYGAITVYFNPSDQSAAFASTPAVVATLYAGYTDASTTLNTYKIHVANAGTNFVTFRIFNASGADVNNTNVRFSWVAVGN